ncbi:hypothetical protein WJX72_010731 [[Myrmecia] bisecta]|uniref:Uncharacterized protein n=1 Tax=[Myrmecia] bisecta TaxID=41462 RepID=A0AAW1Q107_9CHLO
MQALKRWCSDTITTPLKYDIDEGRSFPERIGRIPESERTGRRRMLLQAHNTMTTAYDSMADLLRTGTFPEENARLRLVGDDVNARQGVLGLLAEVVKAQNLADGFATLKPEWDAVFMSTARAMLTSRPPSMDSFSPSNFLAHAVIGSA